MAVDFMFAASKSQWDSVPVVDYTTLGRLKDEIYNLKFRAGCEKRRPKEAFDFRVFDADTKEEILGAHSRVRSNSRVVVKRVPAYVVSELEKQQLTIQSCREGELREPFKFRENAFEDGFGDDVYSTSCSGYSTTSSLTAIESLEVKKKDAVVGSRIGRPRVLQGRRVEEVVLKTNSDVKLESVAKAVALSAQMRCKDEVPLELTCFLCHEIMKDPVLIPCCCISFCRKCVTNAILEHKNCPKCGLSKCRASDLLPNRNTSDRILSFLKSSEIACDIVTVSSNGSCSSEPLVSSIFSEHGEGRNESNKILNDRPSVDSHVASQKALCNNLREKRKAPLGISSMSPKKSKMDAVLASAS